MKCQKSETCVAAQNPDWNPTCCDTAGTVQPREGCSCNLGQDLVDRFSRAAALGLKMLWFLFCPTLAEASTPSLVTVVSIYSSSRNKYSLGLCWHQMVQSTRELWVLLLFWMVWQQNVTTVEIFLHCRRCSSPVNYFWFSALSSIPLFQAGFQKCYSCFWCRALCCGTEQCCIAL